MKCFEFSFTCSAGLLLQYKYIRYQHVSLLCHLRRYWIQIEEVLEELQSWSAFCERKSWTSLKDRSKVLITSSRCSVLCGLNRGNLGSSQLKLHCHVGGIIYFRTVWRVWIWAFCYIADVIITLRAPGLWRGLNSSDLFQDRPAMQLYQPGARSRSRLCQYEDSAAKSTDQGAEKKQESESSNMKEEEWPACRPYVFWLSVQPKSLYYAIQKCLRSEEGTKEEEGALCCWMFLAKEPQL